MKKHLLHRYRVDLNCPDASNSRYREEIHPKIFMSSTFMNINVEYKTSQSCSKKEFRSKISLQCQCPAFEAFGYLKQHGTSYSLVIPTLTQKNRILNLIKDVKRAAKSFSIWNACNYDNYDYHDFYDFLFEFPFMRFHQGISKSESDTALYYSLNLFKLKQNTEQKVCASLYILHIYF